MNKQLALITILAISLFETKVLANINGSTLQSFNPSSSNGSFVTVQSAQTLESGKLNIGGFLDFARNSLPPALDNSNQKFAVKNEILSSDLHLAYGLLKNFEIGASIGSVLQASSNQDSISDYYANLGLTDVRINAKYMFYEIDKWKFAANLQAQFPQIENDYFYGEGSVPISTIELIASVYDGPWTWGLNLGYNVRNPGPKIVGGPYEPVGSLVLGSLALAHRFEDSDFTGVLEAWGAQPTEGTPNYTRSDLTATELLAGLKYTSHPNLEWQAGYTHGTKGGISTPDHRIYIGFNWLIDLVKKSEEPIPTPATPAIAAPVPVQTPAVGNFVISNINFKTNSAEISTEYANYLDRFAEFVRNKPSFKSVIIKGHTDNTGPVDYNKALSLKRANAVKDYLVKNGKLPADKVKAEGFGVESPIAPNNTKEGRKLNRRIEFLVEE